jgi:hypothetical protein
MENLKTLKLSKLILDDNNWHIWRHHLEMINAANGYSHLLTDQQFKKASMHVGTFEATSSNQNLENDLKTEKLLHHALKKWMGTTNRVMTMHCKTAIEVWTTLRNPYEDDSPSHRRVPRNRLRKITLKNVSKIPEFLSEIKIAHNASKSPTAV